MLRLIVVLQILSHVMRDLHPPVVLRHGHGTHGQVELGAQIARVRVLGPVEQVALLERNVGQDRRVLTNESIDTFSEFELVCGEVLPELGVVKRRDDEPAATPFVPYGLDPVINRATVGHDRLMVFVLADQLVDEITRVVVGFLLGANLIRDSLVGHGQRGCGHADVNQNAA